MSLVEVYKSTQHPHFMLERYFMVQSNHRPSPRGEGSRRLKWRRSFIPLTLALLLIVLSLLQSPLPTEAAITPLGNEFTVNTTTAGRQEAPVTAALPNGNFVVAWEDSLVGDVMFRIYNSAGVPQT